MSPIASILLLSAFSLLAVFPPDAARPESWLAFTLLLGALSLAGARRYRLNAAMLLLGLGVVVLSALFCGASALASVPMLGLAAASFMAGQALLSRADFREKLALAFSGVIVLELGLALTQWHLSIPGADPSSGVALRLQQGRVWGSFLTPNILGAWLLLALPLIAAMLPLSRSRASQLCLAGALALGGILFWRCRSGGSFLALALSLAFCALLLLQGRARQVMIAAALLAASGLGVVLAWRGFTVFGSGSGQDLFYNRLILWRPAFHAFMQHPWLGWGPAIAVQAFKDAQRAGGEGFGLYPHQALLSLALNYGIAGLVALGAFAWLVLARIRRQMRVDKAMGQLGLLVAAVAATLHCQWELGAQRPEILLTLIFVVGGLCGEAELEPDSALEAAAGKPLPAAWLLALLGLLVFRAGLEPWQWVLASLALVGMLSVAIQARVSWRPEGAFEWLLSALFAWAALSTTWSLDPGKSAVTACALGMLWIAYKSAVSAFNQGFLGLWQAWFSMLLAASLLFFLGGPWSGAEASGHEWTAAFSNPDVRFYFPNLNLFAAGILLSALLFGVAAIQSGAWRPLAVVALPLLLLFFSRCGSRGAIVALGGALGWYLLRQGRAWAGSRLRLAAAFAAVALLLALLRFGPGSMLAERMQRQENPATADARMDLRREIWEASWRLSLESPWRGQGLGAYERAMDARPLETHGTPRLVLEHAHNGWLEIFCELGLPGLLLALAALAALLGSWWREEAGPLDLALEAFALAIALHAFVDYDFSNPYFLLSFMLAVALRAHDKARSRSGSGIRFSPAWALGLFASFTACLAWGLALEKGIVAGLKSGASGVGLLTEISEAECFNPLSSRLLSYHADAWMSQWSQERLRHQMASAVIVAAQARRQDPVDPVIRADYAQCLLVAVQNQDEDFLRLMGEVLPDWEWIRAQFPGETAAASYRRLAGLEFEAIQKLSWKFPPQTFK